MRTPTAVLFDLDGTLLDGSSTTGAARATCEYVAALVPGATTEELARANAEVWSGYWPGVERAWALGTLDDAALAREAWRRTLARCGLHDDHLAQMAAARHATMVERSVAPFADVLPTLSRLRAAGLLLGLVTNGAGVTQRSALRQMGIEDLFAAVIVSAEVGVVKPDPKIFEIALSLLGSTAGEAVNVGDRLSTDVAGAAAAGIRAVWLNRAGRVRNPRDPAPCAEIATLSRLPGLIGVPSAGG